MGIDISDNTIVNCKNGIRLWSQVYSTHTTGYGLAEVTITSNNITLTQDYWTTANGFDEVSSGIRVNGPTADLPIRGLTITENTIHYTLESNAARLHSTLAPAIGWITPVALYSRDPGDFPAGCHAGLENCLVMGNTIVNSPVNAFNFSTAMRNVCIKYNEVSNCGSSLNVAILGAYRAGFLCGHSRISTRPSPCWK